ncbi:MAG: MBL fold metallo-hydrolase [Acidobacteriota bacterium]
MSGLTFDLGSTRVTLVSDGTFALDGGAMFGIVPRALWSKVITADGENRVRLGLNCLLVRCAGHVMVVDTGIGEKTDARFNARHAVRRGSGLLGALEEEGVSAAEVTDVINSHLHWDHAGGNTRRGEGEKAVATFPRATYHCQRGEFSFARAPTPRTRGSYHAEDYEPLAAAECLHLLDGETEIAPGVTVHPMPGHLPHMQAVSISGREGTLFYPADLIPTAHHLSPAWIMAYDLEPLTTQVMKQQWLERAAREKWTVVFCHDACRPAGKIREQDGRWVLRAEGDD